MSFDIDDLYQAHAFFAVCFSCAGCYQVLEIVSSHESPSDAWCIQAATQAREEGWYVPPEDADGRRDLFTAFCKRCARSRGLVPAA